MEKIKLKPMEYFYNMERKTYSSLFSVDGM